jgi:hypothetical protein
MKFTIVAVVGCSVLISACVLTETPGYEPFEIYLKDSSTNGIPGLNCYLKTNGSAVIIATAISASNYDDVYFSNSGNEMSTIGQASFNVATEDGINDISELENYYSQFTIEIEDPTGVYASTNVSMHVPSENALIIFNITNANGLSTPYNEYTNNWIFMKKIGNS